MSKTDTKTLDHELNQAILGGDILGAFEKNYAEDVVMQENAKEPRHGKDANRKIEEEFVNSVEEFHGAEVTASAVEGNVAFTEWVMDITFKGGGRTKMQQVAVRRWKNGQVVSERFYYDTAA